MRAERRIQDAHKFALTDFAKAMLPVIDSLEMATKHHEEDPGFEGIKLTHKMFLDALKKFGIEPIKTKDQPFNPDLHEAVSMLPNSGKKANTIIEVMQSGYTLNGRLLRAAMVIIAQ